MEKKTSVWSLIPRFRNTCHPRKAKLTRLLDSPGVSSSTTNQYTWYNCIRGLMRPNLEYPIKFGRHIRRKTSRRLKTCRMIPCRKEKCYEERFWRLQLSTLTIRCPRGNKQRVMIELYTLTSGNLIRRPFGQPKPVRTRLAWNAWPQKEVCCQTRTPQHKKFFFFTTEQLSPGTASQ